MEVEGNESNIRVEDEEKIEKIDLKLCIELIVVAQRSFFILDRSIVGHRHKLQGETVAKVRF